MLERIVVAASLAWFLFLVSINHFACCFSIYPWKSAGRPEDGWRDDSYNAWLHYYMADGRER
jgi:hypothetical protein